MTRPGLRDSSGLALRALEGFATLSAGAGDTGFAAAALVGERGRLISTDFSPDMVEVARRRGAGLGLQKVDYWVIDAERTELDVDLAELQGSSEAFVPFVSDGGYELPGVALCAVAN